MRVHLVDGTYELFRAHFSPRPGHVTPDGRDLKATVGLVASMIALLEDADEQVTHVAVAFDNPIRSFRNDLFDGYKTEAGVPEELLAQFDLVEEGVAALGICVWSMDRWEADDALATGAARMRGDAEQVRIMTPDKDLGQCLRGARVVQVDRMRNKVIDEAALRARRGIGPASIPDFLALVGDSADGIPGIPGFGEKSASMLLGHYEHIEAIPDDPARWAVQIRGAKRLAATLAERRADALLYKKLATLVEDVPLDLGGLPYRGPSTESWRRWCTEIGATRLLDRPRRGSITDAEGRAGSN
jgi:5'-3' exonuclease